MTDYPTGIRYLDAASFQVSHEDPSIPPAKMEGGYVLTRPRFTRRPRRTWSWRYVEMRDSDKTALENFWDQVRGRSAMFNWTHPQTGEVIVVRFGEMKLNFSRSGFGPTSIWDSDPVVVEEV